MSSICVYCLKEIAASDITEDHVIARSWYPANTPAVSKWKVPSCRDCNNRFSKIEDEVLNRLAWCMNPADDAVRHIIDKARRSIDPRRAKSSHDLVHRLNRRFALQRNVVDIADPTVAGVLPSFRRNFDEGSRWGVLVPAGPLEELVTKWIRGVHYCEFGQLVPHGYEVSGYILEDDVAAEALTPILSHASRFRKGPGVEVLAWNVEEEGEFIAQYAFRIWNELTTYGSIAKAEPEDLGASDLAGNI